MATFINNIYEKNVCPVYSAGIQTHNLQNMSLLDQGSFPTNLLLLAKDGSSFVHFLAEKINSSTSDQTSAPIFIKHQKRSNHKLD